MQRSDKTTVASSLTRPFTPIVDNAHVIDGPTQQRLGAIYQNLKERMLSSRGSTATPTDDQDISTIRWQWRACGTLGQAQRRPGFLVVAIKDHKYFGAVRRSPRGDLPDDSPVGQIQREKLVPAFRQANYSKGIYDTIEAYVATLAQKQGFTIEGIDTRKAYRAQERKQPAASNLICGIVVLFVIILILSSASRRGGGGCLQALFWGSLFSNMGGRASRWGSGSGWGGGGFSDVLWWWRRFGGV
jgi:uncharacterized protein